MDSMCDVGMYTRIGAHRYDNMMKTRIQFYFWGMLIFVLALLLICDVQTETFLKLVEIKAYNALLLLGAVQLGSAPISRYLDKYTSKG